MKQKNVIITTSAANIGRLRAHKHVICTVHNPFCLLLWPFLLILVSWKTSLEVVCLDHSWISFSPLRKLANPKYVHMCGFIENLFAWVGSRARMSLLSTWNKNSDGHDHIFKLTAWQINWWIEHKMAVQSDYQATRHCNSAVLDALFISAGIFILVSWCYVRTMSRSSCCHGNGTTCRCRAW